MKTQHAFTLVELLVTMAVFGILAVAAIPAFNNYVTNNRLFTDSNMLITSLNVARNEAVKRGTTVSVCRSADGTSCATDTSSWEKGWIVFVNSNNDVPAKVDGGELIIFVNGALNGGEAISASATFDKYITFQPTGISSATGQFVLCDNAATTATARTITVSRSGKPSLATGGNTCTAN